MSTDAKQRVIRQWVSMPGGSCDVRVGRGALEIMGTVVKGSVGKPRQCLLVADDAVSEDTIEQVRRQLTDAGYRVSATVVASTAQARTLASVEQLSRVLVRSGVTADDLVCAVGGSDALALASFTCASWCGGTPLVNLPTDLLAALEAGTTPRGIDVADTPQMLSAKAGAKYQICDLDLLDLDPHSPMSLYGRALMATAALCDAEPAVSRLWDRAELLAAGDVDTLQEQIADTAKSRGHIVSSTSIATRQSIQFGQTFMRAASRLAPEVPQGLLLAEGVRFQARISAAENTLPVDDVLTMDELLDLLELEPVSCQIDPDELCQALRDERFLRTSRFVLCLPRGIGRVRPASVDEETLREHVAAWCASRATL